jgi:hypothetical protein
MFQKTGIFYQHPSEALQPCMIVALFRFGEDHEEWHCGGNWGKCELEH